MTRGLLNVSGVMADLLATARADALALRAGAPLVAPARPANHGALVLPIGCPNCEGAFTMRASSPARWNRVAAVLDCARQLVAHALTAKVPVFFKQVGGRTPTAGGHLLDGREIRQFPKFVFHRKGATS